MLLLLLVGEDVSRGYGYESYTELLAELQPPDVQLSGLRSWNPWDSRPSLCLGHPQIYGRIKPPL